MSRDAVAIIPARGGSKRIPGKNIRPFNGVPIIGHSIEAAQRSGLFGRILVSTDSEEIAAVAARFGAECAFRRPPELADDHTATAPVVRHALEWLAAERATVPYACCIYATAPFIRAADLTAGYAALREHDCSSVFTVATFGFPIWRALKLTDRGTLAMIWPEHGLTRSQDLPEAYQDAGQFYWLNVPRFLALDAPTLYFADSRPLRIPRWRVQDIDTEEDWQRAELMHRAWLQGEPPLSLRRATLDDAPLLLAWRNDPETRSASLHAAAVEPAEHEAWLTGVLNDPTRQLYVALEEGQAVGTVRADLADGVHCLSWSTAPSARGRGVAQRMVTQLVAQIAGGVRAEIKTDNVASIRVAEHAGLAYAGRSGDVLHYRRDAKP